MPHRFAFGIIAAFGFVGCGDCRGAASSAAQGASSESLALPSTPTGSPMASAPATEELPPPSTPKAVPALTDEQADERARGPVELLGVGNEPRRALRHEAKAGARVRLAVAYEVAMMQSTRGEDPTTSPVPAFGVETTFLRVGSGDKRGWKVSVDAARPVADSEVEKLLADEVAPLMKTLEGKAATFLADAKGLGFVAKSHPDGLDRDGLQLWSSVEETARDWVPPLPEEPIGVGARWRAVWRMNRAGVAFVRVAEFELKPGQGVVLDVSVHEEPVASKARDPLVPDGVTVSVRSGVGEGKGTLEFEQDFTPRAGTFTLESWSDLAIQGPAGSEPVFSTLRLKQTTKTSRLP